MSISFQSILQDQPPLEWLIDCITWNPRIPRSHSISLLVAWCFLCANLQNIFIYIVPLTPIIWAAYAWTHHDHISVSQRNVIRKALLRIQVGFDKYFDFIEWKDRQRSRQLFITMLYTYVVWVTAHQIMPTRLIVMVTGLVFMLQKSPWMNTLWEHPVADMAEHVIRTGWLDAGSTEPSSQTRAKLLQATRVKGVINGETSDPIMYTFTLYEHQRTWPFEPNKWRLPTLSFERAPWTDEFLHPVPPLVDFTLPESSGREGNVSWEWTWIDTAWQTPHPEWEYGSLVWSSFGKPIQFWMPTRRRRWTRLACLTCTKDIKKEEPKEPKVNPIPTVTETITTITASALPPPPVEQAQEELLSIESYSFTPPPIRPVPIPAPVREAMNKPRWVSPHQQPVPVTIQDTEKSSSQISAMSAHSLPVETKHNSAAELSAFARRAVESWQRDPSPINGTAPIYPAVVPPMPDLDAPNLVLSPTPVNSKSTPTRASPRPSTLARRPSSEVVKRGAAPPSRGRHTIAKSTPSRRQPVWKELISSGTAPRLR